MRRFVNLFRSPRDTTTPNDPTPSATPQPQENVEYTDGSDSYSYEEADHAPPPPGPPAVSRAPPPSVQPQLHTPLAAQPSRRQPQPSPRQQHMSRRRASDRDSESSHYNLRSSARRAQRPAVPSPAAGLGAADSEGSMSQRDMRAKPKEKPIFSSVKPRDDGPRLAIPTLPHYGSARTTSGVLGHPGRVNTADIENATYSALRTFCAELGVPAAGTKAELRDRALRNLSRKEFHGEEVQRLESRERSKGGPSALRRKPTPAPSNDSRRETITTTARGSAVKEPLNATTALATDRTDRTDSGAKRLGSKDVPSSAELSSTALFKMDSANLDSNGNSNRDRSKRLAFRGAPIVFDSQSAQNCNNPAAHLALPPLVGLAGSVTATPTPMGPGGHSRRPPTVPPSATAASDASRPDVDFVSAAANSKRDRIAASETHLDGIRLVSVDRDQRKVDVPPGIDSVSPAGRKLPAIFAGAEGGPSGSINSNAPRTGEDDNRNGKSNTNGNGNQLRPPAAPSPSPSRPTDVANNGQVPANAKANVTSSARTAQPTAPTLPPIRPVPRRGSSNGFATPADIVRTFNRYTPRRPSTGDLERAAPNTQSSPLFRQGARPSSERFPNLNRVRGSAFAETDKMDKRASTTRAGLTGPFSNSLFSPSPASRRNKRHSTGMASFRRANGNYGGRLNDLRKDLGNDNNNNQRPNINQRPPPLVSLKDVHNTDKWRRDDHAIAMASSARRILAAIRRTSEENRVLCANRKPLAPLGPPPSLKRARDEVEEPTRKRTRREPSSSAPTAAPAGGAPNMRGIPFDFGFSPKIIRPSRNEERRTNESTANIGNRTPSKSALKRRSRGDYGSINRNSIGRSDGFNRTLSVPGSVDRKRRLGPRDDEESQMKQRSSKRRSLSFAAVAAVKKAVKESENSEKATTPVKEVPVPKKAVTFSQQLEKPSEFFGDGPPAKKNPFTTVPEITPAASKAVVPLGSLETDTDKESTIFEKPAFSFTAPAPAQPPAETEKAAPVAEKTTAVAEKTPAPAVEPVVIPSFNFGTNPVEKPSEAEKEPTFSFKIPPPAPVEPEKETPPAPVAAVEKPAVLAATEPRPTFSFGDKPEINEKKPADAPALAFSCKAPVSTLEAPAEPKETPAAPTPTPVAPATNIFAAPPKTDALFGADPASSAATKTAPVFSFSQPVANEADSTVAAVETKTDSANVFAAPKPAASTAPKFSLDKPAADEPTFGSLPGSTSSFVAPSTSTAFGAPKAPTSTPFGSSAAAPAATGFGSSSASLGFSAPSDAFGASSSAAAIRTSSSSNAFGAKPDSAPFRGSISAGPFGSSTPVDKTHATPSAGPFGTSSNAFGSSSAAFASSGGFGASASNPFAVPTPSQSAAPPLPFGLAPAFGADTSNSAGPFSSFGAPTTANANSNPFAPPSSGFGAPSTNAGPAKPFIFSAVVPSQTTNPPAAAGPFGNASSNAFGAGGNAPPSNPFGAAPSFGSGQNQFGTGGANPNPFGSGAPAATAPAFGQFNAGGAAPAPSFGAAPPQGNQGFGAPQQPNMFDAPQNSGSNQFNMGARGGQQGAPRGRKFLRAKRMHRR